MSPIILDARRELCTSGRFVVIALDAHGKPAAVQNLSR
jgi:acyl-CoA hydrolase